jgi:hypothetical protein
MHVHFLAMSKIIPQIWKSDKYKSVAKDRLVVYAKTIANNNGQ